MKQQQQSSSEGVRQRVNQCMSKLSDRDTEAMAAAELDAMARSIDTDALPPFLSAISDSRPSDKTPLRRQPLRVLTLLSAHHPADALLPHLPRMLSAALRRLRDPDSSVRSALVEAVRAMAAAHPPAIPAVVLRPLTDALLHEQDLCAQTASALCLAAAVDAADPDLAHHLQRLLPRLVKLLHSNAFKAKPALISLLGSLAAAGGASTQPLLGLLVPCLAGFLACEDWAARKAAAEALSQVAISDRDLLGGLKSSCLSSFESRRFDKVKIVRDSMNRMLEVWKDIPEAIHGDTNALPPSQSHSNSSLKETGSNGRFSSASNSSVSPFIARKSRFPESRSPPPNPSPVATARKNTTPSRGNRSIRPFFRKMDQSRNSDWRIEVSVPQTPPFTAISEEKLLKTKDQEQEGVRSNERTKTEAKRMLFEKNCEDKAGKLSGLKSVSRVVPLNEAGGLESTAGGNGDAVELHGSHKDSDLSLICMQLVQIENQQSNLLDLLQRFIGSSQNGLHSLETRVHGLEMALNEISRDLAASSGRFPNTDPTMDTCCRFPGAEILTSKFWRRTEGRYSSRLPISSHPALADPRGLAGRQGQEPYSWDKPRLGLQGGFVVNPLAEINSQSRGTIEALTPVIKC